MEGSALAVILEQDVLAFALQHGLDWLGEHAEQAGQHDPKAHHLFLDADFRFDRLPHRRDRQGQFVSGPTLLSLGRSAWDMVAQLVDIAGNPAACLGPAERMGEIY